MSSSIRSRSGSWLAARRYTSLSSWLCARVDRRQALKVQLVGDIDEGREVKKITRERIARQFDALPVQLQPQRDVSVLRIRVDDRGPASLSDGLLVRRRKASTFS